MEEIVLTKDTFLGSYCSIFLNGEFQTRCFEARVAPLSFAEPTHGFLLIEAEDGALVFREDGLRESEIELQGLACKWVTGLVLIQLDSGIVCPACGVKDLIKYNSGIDKVWCKNCGVDASKVSGYVN